MTDTLLRSVASPLEVVGDGRTIIGLVCPYDKIATVNDGFGPFRETFDRGAFDRITRAKPTFVRLHLEHTGAWVGRGDRWLPSEDGLRMALRVDDTDQGRAAVYKIRDGQTPGFSIGFVPGKTMTKMHADGPVEHRMSVKALHHVAVVPQPAYADAQVASVRACSTEAERLVAWQAWLNSQSP